MTAVDHAELKRLAECLHGPHEWGYRDPVEGGFIEDDRPYRASEALYALLSEIEGLKAERDEARAGRSIIAGGSMDMAVMYASANERADAAEAALRTQAPDSWRPDRDFAQSVADVEIEDIDLEYAVVNLLHGRGAIDKKTKTDAVVAVKTLRAIIKAAKALRPQTAESGK